MLTKTTWTPPEPPVGAVQTFYMRPARLRSPSRRALTGLAVAALVAAGLTGLGAAADVESDAGVRPPGWEQRTNVQQVDRRQWVERGGW